MTYFEVNKNGKTYEVELECRVVNSKGSWETSDVDELITEEMLDEFRKIAELDRYQKRVCSMYQMTDDELGYFLYMSQLSRPKQNDRRQMKIQT